jgi:hypothetical protein
MSTFHCSTVIFVVKFTLPRKQGVLGEKNFSGTEEDITSNLGKEPKMHDLLAEYKPSGFEPTNYRTQIESKRKEDGV